MSLSLIHTAGMDRDERLESLIEATKAYADQLVTEARDQESAVHVYNAMLDLQRARRECAAKKLEQERWRKANA